MQKLTKREINENGVDDFDVFQYCRCMTYQSIVKEFIQRIKDSGVKILMCPSPHRGKGAAIEYTDYETAAYYRKWLESGKALERYAEHQEAGFPLFDGRMRNQRENGVSFQKSLSLIEFQNSAKIICMRVQESNLFGMTVIHVVEDDCPFCGREMTNVVFYGTVCTDNDCQNSREKNSKEDANNKEIK